MEKTQNAPVQPSFHASGTCEHRETEVTEVLSEYSPFFGRLSCSVFIRSPGESPDMRPHTLFCVPPSFRPSQLSVPPVRSYPCTIPRHSPNPIRAYPFRSHQPRKLTSSPAS